MKKLFISVFSLLFLTNAFVIFGVHDYYVSSIFSMISLFVLPGILILKALRIQPMSFWEYVVLNVGSSIACVMFLGLGINTLFPYLSISQPLSQIPYLISFDVCIVVLYMAVYLLSRSKYKVASPRVLYMSKKRKTKVLNLKLSLSILFIFVSIIFILLSILGTVSLNNAGANTLTVVQLGGIGIFVLLLMLLRNRVHPVVFPTSLYCIGLSILLSSSLRSWYISGHDIQWEYFVFQLTKQNYLWNIDLYRDAYNACLSITILPTILSGFLQITDVYIYKVVYQVLFALSPVVVYLFLKKYTTPIIAFLSSFFFISFPTFLMDMPMLNRQEIGFLFFALFIYLLFGDGNTHADNRIHQKKQLGKMLLLHIFTVSMVVSHYSTTYVAVGLVTGVYTLSVLTRFFIGNRVLNAFLRKRLLLKKLNVFSQKQYITLTTVCLLIVTTFLWNSLLTKTSGGLSETILKTVTNIHKIFESDNKSADIAYSLIFSNKIDNDEYIENYINGSAAEAARENPDDLLPKSAYAKYAPEIIKAEKLPVTIFGRFLANFGFHDIFLFNYFLRQFFARFVQIVIIIGIIGLLYYRSKNTYDGEYVLMCLVSVLFILLMIVLPQLSLSYGLLRLFQQLLLFLALPLTMGNMLLIHRIARSKTLYAAGGIAVLFFLTLTGFISEITGGYYPQYHLNNGGLYFEAYYSHETELTSIAWLKSNMIQNTTVQADSLTGDKLYSADSIYYAEGVIPQVTRRSSYIYAGNTNNNGKTVLSVDRNLMIQFPHEFLAAQKDIIYSNGLTSIYK